VICFDDLAIYRGVLLESPLNAYVAPTHTLTENAMSLQFDLQAGEQYQVEGSDNLVTWFAIGQSVHLKILGGRVIVQGTVKWCGEAEGSYRVGIQFSEEDWSVLEHIRDLQGET
ncbi:MAG: PilZ domain-containing protein, partial [bacterium]